ncbi:MAG: hypothetical protein JNK87_35790 [Bryobacterales bacterium]|nr:hypothetical protein [Bryobacterales bacterium]
MQGRDHHGIGDNRKGGFLDAPLSEQDLDGDVKQPSTFWSSGQSLPVDAGIEGAAARIADDAILHTIWRIE